MIATSKGKPIINNKYAVDRKIGQGKFGIVYGGINLSTQEKIAVKTEDASSPIKILKHETTILNHLYYLGCRCTPPVYWYGLYNDLTCLVMPFYECSLDVYIKNHQNKYGIIDKIMVKCIELLEQIHSHSVVHRDIKPQNFMIRDNNLYLIDFGFATFFVDEYKSHIQHTSKKENIIGTLKYISYNVHDGYECVRRDDLISIGYIYILFYTGELPWNKLSDIEMVDFECTEGLYPETHIEYYKNKLVKFKKQWSYLSIVCENINPNIKRYMEYCYKLKFEHEPNYSGLKELFGSTID